MSNEFEDAKHQGYSAADMASDVAEQMARYQELGCMSCIYAERYSNTCLTIRENADTYTKCPYRKEN